MTYRGPGGEPPTPQPVLTIDIVCSCGWSKRLVTTSHAMKRKLREEQEQAIADHKLVCPPIEAQP